MTFLAVACGGQAEERETPSDAEAVTGDERTEPAGSSTQQPATPEPAPQEPASAPAPSATRGDDSSATAGDDSVEADTRDCEEEPCSCETNDDCPDFAWQCLPLECGEPSVCRYGASSAAAFPPAYVCACEGVIDRKEHPGVPDVYAYDIPRFYFGGSLGEPCDAQREQLGVVSAHFVGSALPWPDGTLVWLAARGFRLISLEVNDGAVDVTIDDFSVYEGELDPDYYISGFFVDENGDAACNEGEVSVSVEKQFDAVGAELTFRLQSDEESLMRPCTQWLSEDAVLPVFSPTEP